MGSSDPYNDDIRESEMKMKSLFVMGMMATTLVNNAEAQSWNGNNGGGPFAPGFGFGSNRNQDLFQIRELQQTYTEYMRASNNLKQLYVDLNSLTTKLGRNLTKIDEFKEKKRLAKTDLEEKSAQVTRLTNKVTDLTTKKDAYITKIAALELKITELEGKITDEKSRVEPFLKVKKKKYKAVKEHQPTYDAAKNEVDAAITKMA